MMLVENYKLQLQRLFLAGILLFIAWFCWVNRAVMAKVLELSFAELALVLLSYLLLHFLSAAMTGRMLLQRGRAVPLWQLLLINARAALLGQVGAKSAGPAAAKAQLLRRLHQVPVTVSLGLFAFLSLVTIFTNSALGILTGVWAMARLNMAIAPLYWLVLSSSMLLCVSIVLGIYKLGGVYKLPRKMQVWVANLYAVFSGTNVKEVLGMIAMTLLTIPLQVLALGILFRVFGQEMPLVYLMFIAIFSSLVLVVSVTPGNLGIRELIILLLVAHLDISAVDVLCILLVDRLLHFSVVAALGISGYQALREPTQAPVQVPASTPPEPLVEGSGFQQL